MQPVTHGIRFWKDFTLVAGIVGPILRRAQPGQVSVALSNALADEAVRVRLEQSGMGAERIAAIMAAAEVALPGATNVALHRLFLDGGDGGDGGDGSGGDGSGGDDGGGGDDGDNGDDGDDGDDDDDDDEDEDEEDVALGVAAVAIAVANALVGVNAIAIANAIAVTNANAISNVNAVTAANTVGVDVSGRKQPWSYRLSISGDDAGQAFLSELDGLSLSPTRQRALLKLLVLENVAPGADSGEGRASGTYRGHAIQAEFIMSDRQIVVSGGSVGRDG